MADYYEIFMTQFVTTLAQLTAGILSASVAVPVYSYYTRGTFTLSEYNDHYNEIHNSENESDESEMNQSENDDTESINNISNEVHLSNDDN